MTQNNAEHVDRLLKWRAGETPGPLLLTLFPTNRCNLECTICWQRWADISFEDIPDERLLKLVDEAAELGVREWILVGGGEPMVRSKLIMKMCARIRELGMTGQLCTNGTLFKPEHIEHLIDIEWPSIVVSLDGPTPETNDAVRSAPSFEKATANLRMIRDIKAQRNADLPTTALNTTLTNAVYDKLDQMIELVHDTGCTGGIVLSSLIVQGEATKRFAMSKAQREELGGHVERAIARAKELRVTNNFAAFLPKNRVHPGQENAPTRPAGCGGGMASAYCFEPWVAASITACGRLGPCCAFWDDDADNINDMSLKEAWLGPYMQRVRERILTDDLPDYCARCPYTLTLRTEALRARLGLFEERAEERRSPLKTAAKLAVRSVATIREKGLRETIKRAREWRQVRKELDRSSSPPGD